MLKLAYFIVHKVYHNEADERGKKKSRNETFFVWWTPFLGGHFE